MRIAFRTDASLAIGTGHVMRCLALADLLHAQGAQCTFVCREHPGHLLDWIGQRGHRALTLPAATTQNAAAQSDATHVDLTHADWLGVAPETDALQTLQALEPLGPQTTLVVDHYALDARWEAVMRPSVEHLMVIDDLADRQHDCDLLLDQNLGRRAEDYDLLVAPPTHRLIGPAFALLRPEFAQLRPSSLARRTHNQPAAVQQSPLKNLLITLGGVDKDDFTGQILDALKSCPLPPGLSIAVVMGPHAPFLQRVQEQAAAMPCPTQVLVGVKDMAALMQNSDVCIGAAGSTAWERCCLGLPTLQCVTADNQRAGANALASAGAVIPFDTISPFKQALQDAWVAVALQPLRLAQLSKAAATVCDGLGTQRVAQALMSRSEVVYG